MSAEEVSGLSCLWIVVGWLLVLLCLGLQGLGVEVPPELLLPILLFALLGTFIGPFVLSLAHAWMPHVMGLELPAWVIEKPTPERLQELEQLAGGALPAEYRAYMLQPKICWPGCRTAPVWIELTPVLHQNETLHQEEAWPETLLSST